MAKKSDTSNLQKLAVAFLQEAALSIAQSAEHLKNHIDAGGGWRMMDGVSFLITSSMSEKTEAFVNEMLRTIGAKAGSHSEAKDRSWNFVRSLITRGWPNDLKEAARALVAGVQADASTVWLFTAPNYTFILQDDVDTIQIGPVRASKSSSIIQSDLSIVNPPIIVDSDAGFQIGNDGPEYHLPAFCWQVELVAASENHREEAGWLIDVAISLLRLEYQDWDTRLPTFPREQESPLFEASRMRDTHLAQNSTSAQFGGINYPKYYLIDRDVEKLTNDPVFTEKGKRIFEASPKSLGARIFDGLGWLTRARRARDKAERFLFLFTALESILSSANSNDPVIQTISRYAGVIATNDISTRFALSKRLSNLYNTRSNLVHRGQREIWVQDVREMQSLTEGIYARILREINISQTFEEFQQGLKYASFGSKWPANAQRD